MQYIPICIYKYIHKPTRDSRGVDVPPNSTHLPVAPRGGKPPEDSGPGRSPTCLDRAIASMSPHTHTIRQKSPDNTTHQLYS